MNIYQCQKWAQKNGFDSAKFFALFPAGIRACTWLDAYLGFFKIEGLDGFITVDDIDDKFPDLECFSLEVVE